jgi:hypothetical protein
MFHKIGFPIMLAIFLAAMLTATSSKCQTLSKRLFMIDGALFLALILL